ncbi:uncharacterized protein LOC124290675 isoform X2 [Haliotis rubra]|uniref:uncharacterized protein LOC124290675 isoform X2 n=1 Tax=Haliotis rubra TaxID=36100 RepID=UPI001EE4FDC8|nr:uncharacterized protein LOC124290675 isoform X2 [Haliotis rubra]
MSSHESGSPFSDQAKMVGSPSSGTYGSTINDVEEGSGNDNDGQSLSRAGIPSLREPATFFDGKIKLTRRAMTELSFKAPLTPSLSLTPSSSVGVCFYYLLHGVLKECRHEMIILVITTIIMVVYLIVNYASGSQDKIKLARLIIGCCLAPVVVVMGLYLGRKYHQPGWLLFRTVGASFTLQAMCNKLFLFLDLLKLDLQLGITLAFFTHVNDPNVKTLDIVVLCVGLVISGAWFILGHMCVRRESKILTYLFTVLSPLELCYVIYKIAMASTHLTLFPALAPCSIATGLLAVVVRIIVIILIYLVSMNYGKGLSEKVFGSQL